MICKFVLDLIDSCVQLHKQQTSHRSISRMLKMPLVSSPTPIHGRHLTLTTLP